ncbi:MAG: hypothetical protein ACI84D_001013, partial [Thalassolituus oleivorans]
GSAIYKGGDQRGIANKVTNDRIDLGEGYLHGEWYAHKFRGCRHISLGFCA